MSTREVEVVPFGVSPGAEIHGVDASVPPSADVVEAVKNAVATAGVVLLRRQALVDEARHVAFAEAFGDTVVPWLHGDERNSFARRAEVGKRPAYTGDHPSCVYFVNGPEYWDNVDDGFSQDWHADLSYLQIPLEYSFAYAVQAPEHGYETWFADQAAAYESLDAATRQRIDGLSIVHSFREAFANLPPVVHPVVLEHPRSGRRALYGMPGYAASAPLGVPQAEGEALMARLTAHVNDDRFLYKHTWRTGDLLVWDNRCVIHRRGDQIKGQTRILRRVPASDGDAQSLRKRIRGLG